VEGHSTVEDQQPRNSYRQVCCVFVHDQLPDVVGMRPQWATTSIMVVLVVVPVLLGSETAGNYYRVVVLLCLLQHISRCQPACRQPASELGCYGSENYRNIIYPDISHS